MFSLKVDSFSFHKYLAAIPTAEELDAGRQTALSQGWKQDSVYWHRKGPFSFSFEVCQDEIFYVCLTMPYVRSSLWMVPFLL